MQEEFLTISEIVRVPNSDKKPLIPVSRSTWLAGVKSGRYPKPVQISERRVAWRKSDIHALMASLEVQP